MTERCGLFLRYPHCCPRSSRRLFVVLGSAHLPPVEVRLDSPSVARVYDYCLGGTTNWALDRTFADRILDEYPLVRRVAAIERLYLNRVVRFLLDQGVRQFLDVGSGVPGKGSAPFVVDDWVDEQDHAVDTRVVCVDNDPLAVAYGKVALDRRDQRGERTIVQADLRAPDALWRTVRDTGLIDPDEPVALLLIAVLHIQQKDAEGNEVAAPSVTRLRGLLPAGSYLAVSHASDASRSPATMAALEGLRQVYAGTGSDITWRSRHEIESMLDGCRMEAPGWTTAAAWRPEHTGLGAPLTPVGSPAGSVIWSGVGRKP
ncbi:SAM-dependent methyltransferase [Actinophytocola glycyrrhizae]|uniref:SAM-dependent methyltransferase n=1 Tax=Actinophytocola glycyrrhizae TaxID=2044873 RepID=A0ABV9SB55_9PSEU